MKFFVVQEKAIQIPLDAQIIPLERTIKKFTSYFKRSFVAL